jgi:hypothetical protein
VTDRGEWAHADDATSSGKVEHRKQSYEKWKQYCIYLGSGYGALVFFGDLAKDSFQLSPYQVRASFITLVLIGGIFLGRAAFGYLQANHKLQLSGLAGTADIPSDKLYRYPRAAFVSYWLALLLGLCAASTLVVAAWWPTVSAWWHRCGR